MKDKKSLSRINKLEKIFHEPNRLEIMSILCSIEKGIAFIELKKQCNLTDGNLNRHLKVLKETQAIIIKKSFVDEKPRTTISITNKGLQHFNDYLIELSKVLQKAKEAMPADKAKRIKVPNIIKTQYVKA